MVGVMCAAGVQNLLKARDVMERGKEDGRVLNLVRNTDVKDIHQFRLAFTRFMLNYEFGMEEVLTKINILKAEFSQLHDYSPIEHVTSRIKSPESIMKKVKARGFPISIDGIRDNIFDIAGIRIVCSFLKDAYVIADMLTQQPDVVLLEVKDYIKNPKPNGYRSLHLIVEIPVFLSHGEERVRVELQIRTIAMDFWASLEHKIYYKFESDIPDYLKDQLYEAAQMVGELDVKMEGVSDAVKALHPDPDAEAGARIELSPSTTLEDLLKNLQ